MLKLKWNLWARSMALCGAWCLAFGGIPFIWAYDAFWPQLAIYAWVVTVVFIVFFYPLEKLGRILIVVQNYYVNALICVGLAVWPCFAVPTLFGGICLGLSGFMWLIAAISGEKGLSLEDLAKGRFQPRAAMQ